VRARLTPHRALVNRDALRLGLTASIPRASHKERLAGGTRGRGSPSAIVITAPSAGAAINRSRRPRVHSAALRLTRYFSCGDAPLAHAWGGRDPWDHQGQGGEWRPISSAEKQKWDLCRRANQWFM